MSVMLTAAGRSRLVPQLQKKGGRIVAGGTLAVADLNYGQAPHATLITLDRLGLDQIAIKDNKVMLGAMVTMARIFRSARLKFLHPVANSIGGPAIRAMATVGGNLFAPPPYGDMAAALLALDAEVSVHDGKLARRMPIESFFKSRAKLKNAFVLSVSFAIPPAGAFRYAKIIRRKPVSASVVTIAACLPKKAGKLSGARIALGAMAAHPVRAHKAEAALEGRPLDKETIAAAAAVLADQTSPADDAYATGWYRREIAPVHFSRLLSA